MLPKGVCFQQRKFSEIKKLQDHNGVRRSSGGRYRVDMEEVGIFERWHP